MADILLLYKMVYAGNDIPLYCRTWQDALEEQTRTPGAVIHDALTDGALGEGHRSILTEIVAQALYERGTTDRIDAVTKAEEIVHQLVWRGWQPFVWDGQLYYDPLGIL